MKPKSGSTRSEVKVSGIIKAYKDHLTQCKSYKNQVLQHYISKGKEHINPLCVQLLNTIKGHANNTKDMVQCLQGANQFQLKSIFAKQGDEFNKNFLFINFLAEQESHKMIIDFHKTIIPIVGDENLYPEWY